MMMNTYMSQHPKRIFFRLYLTPYCDRHQQQFGQCYSNKYWRLFLPVRELENCSHNPLLIDSYYYTPNSILFRLLSVLRNGSHLRQAVALSHRPDGRFQAE